MALSQFLTANKTKPSCSGRSSDSSIPCLLDTFCERKMLLLVLPWTSSCCFLSKDLCFFPHKDLCVLLLLVLGCRDRLLVLVLVATWFWVLGKARVFQTVVAAIYPSCLFLCLFVCVFFGEMLWEEDRKTKRQEELSKRDFYIPNCTPTRKKLLKWSSHGGCCWASFDGDDLSCVIRATSCSRSRSCFFFFFLSDKVVGERTKKQQS